MQAIVLGLDVGELTSIYLSKIMDTPLAILNYKVRRMMSQDEAPISVLDELKLFMYDGHDTQAILLLSWLNPTNFELPHPTVYAS